jgi:hypothetical protein
LQKLTIEILASEEVLKKFVTYYPNTTKIVEEIIRQLAEHPDKVAAGEAVRIKYKPWRAKNGVDSVSAGVMHRGGVDARCVPVDGVERDAERKEKI